MVTQGRAPKAALRAAGYGIVLIAVALAASVVISPAVAAAAPGGAPAAGADARGWARVRSAHFDLLSDGGAAAARPAAAALARFHRVLEGLLPAPPREPDGPLVVLAFTREGSFRGYVPQHG